MRASGLHNYHGAELGRQTGGRPDISTVCAFRASSSRDGRESWRTGQMVHWSFEAFEASGHGLLVSLGLKDACNLVLVTSLAGFPPVQVVGARRQHLLCQVDALRISG